MRGFPRKFSTGVGAHVGASDVIYTPVDTEFIKAAAAKG
jgi:shikimate 5-dehydrogenase